MTTALIGFIIMTLARDLGNRVLAGGSTEPPFSPTGTCFDRTA